MLRLELGDIFLQGRDLRQLCALLPIAREGGSRSRVGFPDPSAQDALCDLDIPAGLNHGDAAFCTSLTASILNSLLNVRLFICCLQKMPAVSDLNRLWKSTGNGAAISAIAISGDACNAGVVTEPSPLIDAEDPRRSLGVIIARPETAQEGIFAHRQQEAACEKLSRPATKRHREVPDQLLHPQRATCPSSGHLRPEALAKYRLMAPGRATPETTHIDHQATLRPCAGKSARRRR